MAAIRDLLQIKSYRPVFNDKNRHAFSREGYLKFGMEHDLLKLSGHPGDYERHKPDPNAENIYSLIQPNMEFYGIHVNWFGEDDIVTTTDIESFIQCYGAIEGYQPFQRILYRAAKKKGQFGVKFKLNFSVDIFKCLVKVSCESDNPLVIPLGFNLCVSPRYLF